MQKLISFWVCFLVFSSLFLRAQASFEGVPEETVARGYKSRYEYLRNSYVESSRRGLFVQNNVGLGFLYFSGVRANLGGIPSQTFNGEFRDSIPLKGKLQYNRTPVFEYELGYQALSCLRACLSYQYQTNVIVQTDQVCTESRSYFPLWALFRSSVEFSTLMLKTTFEWPKFFRMGSLCFKPYIGVGLGAGWQSWTNNMVTYSGIFRESRDLVDDALVLRQKISPNVSWGADLGMMLKPFVSDFDLSITFGCKYNQLGQALSIGHIHQQGGDLPPMGLRSPFRIETIYQFVPYLGAQWNFPVVHQKARRKKRYHEAFVSLKDYDASSFFTQLSIGPSFLYYYQMRADFGILPGSTTQDINPVNYRGRELRQNKTPLMEYQLGFSPLPWFSYALSFQNQQNVCLETPNKSAVGSLTGEAYSQSRFNIQLNSLMLKLSFMPARALAFRKLLAIKPFLGLGFGAGWQSWLNVQSIRTMTNLNIPGNYFTNSFLLRQKISANPVWMVDLGLNFQANEYLAPFYVILGCKYIQWGQARNVGAIWQQGSRKVSWKRPFRVKTLYSFAPYVSMQWSFPLNDAEPTYRISNGSLFFEWIDNRDFQRPCSYFIQGNAGIGFLYFSGIRGDFGIEPSEFSGIGNNQPLRGRLTYNRTPLYEMQVGMQILHWLRGSLSYQTQSGVYVESKYTTSRAHAGFDIQTQFRSRLELNALALKASFESPYTLAIKNWLFTPSLSAGVGPCWQSWINPYANLFSIGGELVNNSDTFNFEVRQKISANVFWMVDLGFLIQNAVDSPDFAITCGCKYNQWGQARSIGKVTSDNRRHVGFFKPFRVKTVYQFAPYLGVQWNF